MNRLSGLLSDKSRKHIIINGCLARKDNALLRLKREKYTVYITQMLPGREEVILEDGMDILTGISEQFNTKYLPIVGTSKKEAMSEYSASVDPFTGAIVLKNELYNQLIDKGNRLHLHDGTVQFKTEVQNLLNEFIKEFIMNYFDIYSYLIDKRLMGSRTPVKIKGHLVSGLYQPLLVATRQIDAPLQLGEFSWLSGIINTPRQCEERLEGVYETTRGLELTAIAMCDFASKFGVTCIKNLNRLYFQFILHLLLIDTIQEGNATEMIKRFKGVYRTIRNSRGSSVDSMSFFIECIEGFKRCRSAIVPY